MADKNEINAEVESQDVKVSSNESESENGLAGGVLQNAANSDTCDNDTSRSPSQNEQNGASNDALHGDSPQSGPAGTTTNGHENSRKLFVGGLTSETTEQELREHFGQYGDIKSLYVKVDRVTGRSKGFAFIVYATPDSIDKVLKVESHVINNKQVDAKRAKYRQGKIFVGGLTSEISDDDIRTHFSQFGTIVQIESPFDKQKNQRKGFCFVIFDSEEVANNILKTPKQVISGKEVDVKKATSKSENMSGMNRRPHGSRLGGRAGNGNAGYAQGWGNFGYGGYGTSGYGGYGNNDYGGNGGYADFFQGGRQEGSRRQQKYQPY